MEFQQWKVQPLNQINIDKVKVYNANIGTEKNNNNVKKRKANRRGGKGQCQAVQLV